MIKRLTAVFALLIAFAIVPSTVSAAPGPPPGIPPVGGGCATGLTIALRYVTQYAPAAIPFIELAMAACQGQELPPVAPGDGGACATGITTAIAVINRYAPATAGTALPFLEMALERCNGGGDGGDDGGDDGNGPGNEPSCVYGLSTALQNANEQAKPYLTMALARCQGETNPPVPPVGDGRCAFGIATAIAALPATAREAALPYLEMALEACTGQSVPDGVTACEFGIDTALSYVRQFFRFIPEIAQNRILTALNGARAQCP